MVGGGDCLRAHAARQLLDMAGPVIADAPSQGFVGATRPPLGAHLAAVLSALDLLADHFATNGPEPAVLRVGLRAAAETGAGTLDPRSHATLRREILKRWRTVRAVCHGLLWLAGWSPLRGYAWGDRACALAEHARLSTHT